VLTDRNRDVLREVWRHQQDSVGEPFWFGGMIAHLRTQRPDLAEAVGDDLPGVLAELERYGYLERVGETEDSARFPLYRLTSAGIQAAEKTGLA
jgi:hypothetical protein